jgi:TrmH family RNA methyltransferase
VPTAPFDAAPRPRVALVMRQGVPLPELPLAQPVTFVLGAEREGLPDELVRQCDEVAFVPPTDAAESLNVAMTGAIALYELRRR